MSLVRLALKNEGLIVPGYTHLQRAQPVLLEHLLLAYVEQVYTEYLIFTASEILPLHTSWKILRNLYFYSTLLSDHVFVFYFYATALHFS